MDSSEEPFTRSPCGLGVTALTIIPAMHTINAMIWNRKEHKDQRGHAASMGQTAGIYKILVRKTYVKKPLGRSRHRGEENINL
jgi:hypothetical protein